MNNSHILALPNMSYRHHSLATLRNMIAMYRARRRFRADLERIARDNPHLIDDMGLARWQVEAEVAKRFWEV